ncbi:hypothetical protein FRIGORI9N_130002 [Frigoribacterium sp. 9N]|nr:hypothetical protein FRIGORI9N_130002 [Frigoribacterium sp. 9N]
MELAQVYADTPGSQALAPVMLCMPCFVSNISLSVRLAAHRVAQT